jgi:hypothetical protein
MPPWAGSRKAVRISPFLDNTTP